MGRLLRPRVLAAFLALVGLEVGVPLHLVLEHHWSEETGDGHDHDESDHQVLAVKGPARLELDPPALPSVAPELAPPETRVGFAPPYRLSCARDPPRASGSALPRAPPPLPAQRA